MPIFENGPVSVRYETYGDGSPVLVLAPGGLRNSRIETWSSAPWNPIEALPGRHRVVAMDQRNTGTSFAPITRSDSWHNYAGDQLALMDHLGIERFAVLGMCIGGAFIMELLELAPERITAAVALQPIGQHGNRDAFRGIFDEWRTDIAAEHPEADDAAWEGMFANLFGGDQLLWSVPDELLPSITTPLLVLRGNDQYHPSVVSETLAATVPGAQFIERWKEPDDRRAAEAKVGAFLAEHAG